MASTNQATNKPPEVRPITKLPDFVRECVDRIWKKYGRPAHTENIVYTFHDAIYAAAPMTSDLFVHECVHYVRQGSGTDLEAAKEWCNRYADDDAFRLAEELLAYREQYRYILRNSNRNVAFEHAKRLATDLSGPMYGSIIGFQAALSKIIAK